MVAIQGAEKNPLDRDLLPADPGRIERQRKLAVKAIKSNIKPNGAIAASPSKKDPNYYYFWPRDGCIAVTVLDLIGKHDRAEKCCDFLRRVQDSCGSWRQRYNLDGTIARGNWADPQHDQTALAIIAMIEHFTQTRDWQYLAEFWPCIKRACDFLYYDRQPTWDLWEETFGYHYNTLYGIIRALSDGGKAALVMGEEDTHTRYMKEVQRLTDVVEQYLTDHGYIKSEYKRIHSVVPHKKGHLDTSVVKAHVHYDGSHIHHPAVENTVRIIEKTFTDYPVNEDRRGKGIGRYPEDKYDGVGHTGGNPWYITTLWMAQYYYLKGNIRRGNEYLDWVLDHIPRNGRMSEQVDRKTGKPRGAEDLTWSYAEFIRTTYLKEKTVKQEL